MTAWHARPACTSQALVHPPARFVLQGPTTPTEPPPPRPTSLALHAALVASLRITVLTLLTTMPLMTVLLAVLDFSVTRKQASTSARSVPKEKCRLPDRASVVVAQQVMTVPEQQSLAQQESTATAILAVERSRRQIASHARRGTAVLAGLIESNAWQVLTNLPTAHQPACHVRPASFNRAVE